MLIKLIISSCFIISYVLISSSSAAKTSESDTVENKMKVAESFPDVRPLMKLWNIAKKSLDKTTHMTSEAQAKMKILAAIPDELAMQKVWTDARNSLLRHPHLTNSALDTVEAFFDFFKRLEHLLKKTLIKQTGKATCLLPCSDPVKTKAVIEDAVKFLNFWNNSYNALKEKPDLTVAYPGKVLSLDSLSKMMNIIEVDNMWENKIVPEGQETCRDKNRKNFAASGDVADAERRWRLSLSLLRSGPPYEPKLVEEAGSNVTGLECLTDLVLLQVAWNGIRSMKLYAQNKKSLSNFRDLLDAFRIVTRVATDWLTSVTDVAVPGMMPDKAPLTEAFDLIGKLSVYLSDKALLDSPEAKAFLPAFVVNKEEESDPTVNMVHFPHQLGNIKILYDSWKRIEFAPELTEDALLKQTDPFYGISGAKNSGLDKVKKAFSYMIDLFANFQEDEDESKGVRIKSEDGETHVYDENTGDEIEEPGHKHAGDPVTTKATTKPTAPVPDDDSSGVTQSPLHGSQGGSQDGVTSQSGPPPQGNFGAAIAGAVIGTLLIAACAAGLAYYIFVFRRKRIQERRDSTDSG